MYIHVHVHVCFYTYICTCTCALYSVYMYVLLDWYDEMCLDDQPVYNEECHGFHELTLCVCVGGRCCVCVYMYFAEEWGKG